MRIGLLYCFASLFVSASVASVTVVQNVIDSVSGLDPKVESLFNGINDALQSAQSGVTVSTASVSLALALYNEAMALIDTTNEITQTVQTCPDLSAEESTTILDVFHQMQPMFETGLQLAVDNKAIIDGLPVGRVNALVGLGLHQLKDCITGLQNALLDVTHLDQLAELQALITQINAVLGTAIVAFN